MFCSECLTEALEEQPARCPLCSTVFTAKDMQLFSRRNNHNNDAIDGEDGEGGAGSTGKGNPKRKGGHDKVSAKKAKTNSSNSPKIGSSSAKCDSLKSEFTCPCMYVCQ